MLRVEQKHEGLFTVFRAANGVYSTCPLHVDCTFEELPEDIQNKITLLNLAEGEIPEIGVCTTGATRIYYIFEKTDDQNTRVELFIP